MASRYQAAQTRLRKFEEAGPPPEPPREQDITDAAAAAAAPACGRVTCEGLELTGLMKPFDLEVFYGERVAVLGSNGSGKSHFLRLLAGRRRWRTPARGSSARGWCPATSPRPTPTPSCRAAPLLDILWTEHAQDRGARDVARCAATSWTGQGEQRFERLSGGQQARFQILLLELAGRRRRCCWTSRPTTSTWSRAEALQEGLEAYEGTVLAVTHDRWFARSFDRYLVFGATAGAGDAGAGVGRAAGGAGAVDRSADVFDPSGARRGYV